MNTNNLISRCSSAAHVSVEFCRKVVAGVVDLRNRLVEKYEVSLPGQSSLVNRAVEEATQLAWETQFPHLFLPDLVEIRLAELAPAYAQVTALSEQARRELARAA